MLIILITCLSSCCAQGKAAKVTKTMSKDKGQVLYVLRGTTPALGAPLWVPVSPSAPIMQSPALGAFLEATRKQMERYPVKDPRIYPFTGRVPLPENAEAKEARLRALENDITLLFSRILATNPLFKGIKSYLQAKLDGLRAEKNLLLAELDLE